MTVASVPHTAQQATKPDAIISAMVAAGATREALRFALDALHSAMTMTPIADEMDGLNETAQRLSRHLSRHHALISEVRALARDAATTTQDRS